MTDKPIKATLDNTDDSVKTQKPILIQLDDIPTPTDADAGKVLGVDDEGKYALTEGDNIIIWAEKYEVIFSGGMPSELDILFSELPVDNIDAAAEYFINEIYDMLATSRKVSAAIKAKVDDLAMDFIAIGDVLMVDKGGGGIQVWLFNPIKFEAEVVAFTTIEKIDAGGIHHFYPALVFSLS